MPLTTVETLMIIGAVALGAIVTRFAPFLLFPDHKEQPQMIINLGKMLPSAMMGLLVIYCLRNITIGRAPHGIPELLAIFFIIFLHKWKNNVLISIGGGTILYMMLVQGIIC